VTRKSGIFAKSLAILCAVLITAIPCGVASAQSSASAQFQGFGQLPATGWQENKLSPAIVNDANRALNELIVANQSGHLTPEILENAATSLQMLFDHLQEIGLNSALEKEILGNQDAFLNFHPTDNDIGLYHSRLQSQGVSVTVAKIRSVMDPDSSTRQQSLSTIAKIGVYQGELLAVAQLREQAQQLAANGAQGAQLTRMSPSSAHLVRVMANVCKACIVLMAACVGTDGALLPICGAAIGTCTTCGFGG
jgi:hypothetical protein